MIGDCWNGCRKPKLPSDALPRAWLGNLGSNKINKFILYIASSPCRPMCPPLHPTTFSIHHMYLFSLLFSNTPDPTQPFLSSPPFTQD